MSEGTDVTRWADKAMFSAEPMERGAFDKIVPKVYLLSATSDPLGAIAAACRMYEGKPTRQLGEVSDTEREHYWEQVKKTHLKAPLEFVDLHFMIEGVTRSFTHQMVRQRTAVYAQESLRFAVKEDLIAEIPLPPSIEEDSIQAGVFYGAIDQIQRGYTYLINNGVPAEDARDLLPHGTTTRLHYKTNLRNLIDHAGNRLCTQAQFQWRVVLSGVVHAMRKHLSYYIRSRSDGKHQSSTVQRQADWQWERIAGDNQFRPVCYALGHCPFTADFDRGCTIRDRVQAGKFNEIDDREWLLDPTAGRVR